MPAQETAGAVLWVCECKPAGKKGAAGGRPPDEGKMAGGPSSLLGKGSDQRAPHFFCHTGDLEEEVAGLTLLLPRIFPTLQT